MKKIALVVFILIGLASYQYGVSLEQPVVNPLQNIDFNKEHPAVNGWQVSVSYTHLTLPTILRV